MRGNVVCFLAKLPGRYASPSPDGVTRALSGCSGGGGLVQGGLAGEPPVSAKLLCSVQS